MQAKVDALFAMYPDGLTIPAMKELVKEVCNSLCYRITGNVSSSIVSLCFQMQAAISARRVEHGHCTDVYTVMRGPSLSPALSSIFIGC